MVICPQCNRETEFTILGGGKCIWQDCLYDITTKAKPRRKKHFSKFLAWFKGQIK